MTSFSKVKTSISSESPDTDSIGFDLAFLKTKLEDIRKLDLLITESYSDDFIEIDEFLTQLDLDNEFMNESLRKFTM